MNRLPVGIGRHLSPGMVGGIALLTALSLFGGASRADEPAQMAVRLAAIAAIASSLLWPGDPAEWRRYRPAFLFVGALAIVMALQLVPLPPAIWTALPGRALYAEAATIAGVAQPWRPIAISPDRAWDSLLGLLPVVSAMMVTAALGQDGRARAVQAIVILALVSMLFGLLQIGEGSSGILRFYRQVTLQVPSGSFANRNHQALLMAIALPAVAVWWTLSPLDRSRRLDRSRLFVAVGLSLAFLLSVLLTGSRAGFALGAAGAAAALAFWYRGLRHAGLAAFRRPAIAIGVAATGIALFVGLAVVLGRAVSLNRLVEGGLADGRRYSNLGPIVDDLCAFFPVGTGFGAFDPIFRRFEPNANLAFTYLNQAHNDWLQLVIEAGIAGVGLALAYLAWWATTVFSLLRRRERGSIAWFGVVSTALILAGSVVDYPLRTPIIGAIFAIAGLAMLTTRNRAAG